MAHTRRLVSGLIAALVVIAGAAILSRDTLSGWAFNLTGEESLAGQVGGLIQLPLNLAQPPLKTEPYAAIEHTGVNPFGVNTFLHHEVEEAKRVRQMQLIAEAGFKWIRQEFPWQDIEIHGRGDFVDRRNDPQGIDAWAKYDHIVTLAEQYNVEIIARLSSPPAWSRADGEERGTFAPPDDYADFARFAATLAERYKGRIRYYQIWNEPNIYPEWGENPVDPEAYTDLLCQTYRAIKAVDPDAVILSGALAPTAELSGRDLNDYIFLQRMYDAGAGACFDILSMQGYGLWSGPTDRRMRPLVVNYGRNQFIRDIMVRNGDSHKAIWISEMNWNVAPEDVFPAYGRATLDQQARWVPLAYQRAQEEWPWIGVVNMWYFKRASDDWLQERRPEAYFQMLEPDFTPLPVYESVKAYANQPAVMYPGNHSVDHWAVKFDENWATYDGEHGWGLMALPGASAAFTFYGTSLQIICKSPTGEGQISYRIDYESGNENDEGIGRFAAANCAGEAIIWRGKKGYYSVTINADREVILSRLIVRDDPQLTPAILIGGTFLLIVAAVVARRRHKLEEAPHESET